MLKPTLPKLLKIPRQHRVRRVKGSPSFRQASKTVLEIHQRGIPKTIFVNIYDYKKDGFDLDANLDNGKRIGGLAIENLGANNWNIFDRYIKEDYRGYYLGRTLFRFVEMEIKKRGGKHISMITNQPDVIRTSLKLGYKLTPHGEAILKRALNLPSQAPLPQTPKLINLLDQQKGKIEPASSPTIYKELI